MFTQYKTWLLSSRSADVGTVTKPGVCVMNNSLSHGFHNKECVTASKTKWQSS